MNEMSEMMHNMTDFVGSGDKYYGHEDSTERTHLRPEKNDSDHDKPENGIYGEGHIQGMNQVGKNMVETWL